MKEPSQQMPLIKFTRMLWCTQQEGNIHAYS